jgi:hypothetical protein
LLLAHKWSRDDIVEKVLASYDRAGTAPQKKAAEVFLRRREAGELVLQRDGARSVGRFVKGNYAEHRYAL